MFLLWMTHRQGDTFQAIVHDYVFCMVSTIHVSFRSKNILIQDTEWSDTEFFQVSTAPSGSEPPYSPGFMIILRHTTHSVGFHWTKHRPYAETLHDKAQHSQVIDIRAPDGLEPASPTREGQQTHNLDLLATEIGLMYMCKNQYVKCLLLVNINI
jgi:hypothetical protein